MKKNTLKEIPFRFAHHLRRLSRPASVFGAVLVLAGSPAATHASSLLKANNTDDLDLTTSWVNGVVPGTSDVAVWDTTVTGPNSTVLSSSLSWSGIQILNPAGLVTISATTTNANLGATLTLGGSGIDMSSATADLTISNDLILADYTDQPWNVPAGRTLSLGGALTRTGGAVLTVNNAGTINIAGGTASTPLTYSLVNNGTDVGSLDATLNLSTVAAVNTYTIPTVGGVTTAAYNDVVNANTGTAADVRLNTTADYFRVIRFNIPQPNRNYWLWDAYRGQTETSTGGNTILVTTNVGACDVRFEATGSGGISMGWRNSGGSELIVDQENTAGSIYFYNGFSQKYALASNMLTKRGAGRAVFNTALVNTGPDRILEGEMMVNSTTPSTSVVTVNNGATLSGIGTISGPITNSGTIWAGTNGLGALTVSNLTLNAGSTLKFYDPALPTTNTTGLLPIHGDLTVNGAVTVSILAGIPALGQYPLILWTNAIPSTAFTNFTLGTMPLRTSGYLSNNVANDSIDLVITNINEPIKWAVGNGNWDIATTANWLDTFGASTMYQEANGVGDEVLFDDSAAGPSPITVTLNDNPVPAKVTVNNSAISYTISGNGSIGGLGALTKTGSGTLVLSTTNTFSSGINLDGGIVNFTTISNLGVGPISFSGGTLQYNGNTDDISTRAVTLNAGGGTIDTAGQNINYANPIGAGGIGGLTKTGLGTLTLNGTNTYAGNTVVNQGTLALGANTYLTNSAAIIVNSGAVLDATTSGVNLVLSSLASQTLAGAGTVNGNVTASTATSISPAGSGVYGTLPVNGALTINGGTLAMDVSPTSKDLISVSGNLTLSSGTLQLNVSGTLANGRYTLISYSGSLASGPGSSGNLNIVGFSEAGHSASLDDSVAGHIDLVIADSASDVLTWPGTGSTWDLAGTLDWLNGATPWAYTNGDTVTFDDSASGNSTVQLETVLTPTAITVNNTTIPIYTFADGTGTGGGKIAGTASLVKNGTGTLIMQTANTYTGPTTINSGTLQVGNGGIGDIGKGNITNNGALVFAQGDGNTHIVTGSISGTGSVTQQGTATVVLSKDSSYAGPTTITSGTLQLGTNGASGTLSTGVVTNNGSLVLDRSGAYSLPNNVIGSGSLSTIGTATITLAGSLAYQGNTYISNGVVKLTANEQLPSANSVAGSTGWLILDGGVSSAGTLDLAGHNQTVNALSGLANTVNGAVTNTGTSATTTNVLTILGSAATTFAGTIRDNPTGSKTALVLLGTNSLTVSTANTYVGGTYLGEGAEIINAGPNALIGNGGNITMSNNSTFYLLQQGGGTFPANNVIVPDGATAIFNCNSLGNGYGGNMFGGPLSTNVIAGPVSFGVGNVEQYANFPGTVVVTSGGTLRFSSTGLTLNGGDQTTFELDGSGVLQTRNAGTVHLGALQGNGFITNPQANTGTGVYQIGFNNANTVFSGFIQGTNSIIKVGTGTLTLSSGLYTNVYSPDGFTFYTNVLYTNDTLSYVGATTISNGVLALAAPTTLTNWPTPITLASSTAVLDGSQMGYISNEYASDGVTVTNQSLVTNGVFEVAPSQSLSGIGTILASNVLADAGSSVTPGLPYGTLNISQQLELAGAVNFNVNATNKPNCGQIVASSIVIDPAATLTVTNLGGEYGATFQLFNHPVSGFASVNLPTLSGTNTWVNNLAVDGSITLVAPPYVNTNPTNITAVYNSGTSSLTLSWPADHTGWRLQVQTNTLATGIYTNWVDVAGANTTNQEVIPVSPTNGAVFFRMVYP